MFRFLLCALVWTLALPLHAAPASQTILVLGDSLSAGYGLNEDEGWVALFKQKLKREGFSQTVVNASVSGETTAGGLARLPALLQRHRPQLVLIELGGNDGLRALPLKAMRANLEQMISLSRQADAVPAVFEMRIPSNYGAAFADAFYKSFAEVARSQKATLVPFFLAPIVGRPGQFQEDGIHPSAAAQPQMLDAAWPTLKSVLRR
jgi:acyl-CoA thioesterase-1